MSKSNWNGSSGWSSVTDPTGVLAGKVLVVTAGITSKSTQSEDYLKQIPQTSIEFTENHYSVIINYGWGVGSGLHPMSMGELGLVARASNFTTSGIAGNAYIGKFNIQTGLISIVRRYASEETTLIEVNVPSDVLAKGVKHNMEFKCYGTNPVTLQFSIDNTLYCTFGDTSASLLSSGLPGIHAKSGTVYVDNFTIVKYTSNGRVASPWLPSNSTTSLAAWWKADTGTTIVDGKVSNWSDQSGNNNTLAQSTAGNRPLFKQAAVLKLPAISFAAETQTLHAADSATLDITSGISIFTVSLPFTMDTPAGRKIIEKGTNYEFKLTNTNNIQYITATTDTSTGVVSENTFQLFEVISGDKFYINGTDAGPTTAANGSANNNALNVVFKNGYIGEIVVFNGTVSNDDRQKVEGYLAHKWKISILLPITHPYRNYAPLL